MDSATRTRRSSRVILRTSSLVIRSHSYLATLLFSPDTRNDMASDFLGARWVDGEHEEPQCTQFGHHSRTDPLGAGIGAHDAKESSAPPDLSAAHQAYELPASSATSLPTRRRLSRASSRAMRKIGRQRPWAERACIRYLGRRRSRTSRATSDSGSRPQSCGRQMRCRDAAEESCHLLRAPPLHQHFSPKVPTRRDASNRHPSPRMGLTSSNSRSIRSHGSSNKKTKTGGHPCLFQRLHSGVYATQDTFWYSSPQENVGRGGTSGLGVAEEGR